MRPPTSTSSPPAAAAKEVGGGRDNDEDEMSSLDGSLRRLHVLIEETRNLVVVRRRPPPASSSAAAAEDSSSPSSDPPSFGPRTPEDLARPHGSLEDVHASVLDVLRRTGGGAPSSREGESDDGDDARRVMAEHLASKAADVALAALIYVAAGAGSGGGGSSSSDAAPDFGPDGQAVVARIAELALRLRLLVGPPLLPAGASPREDDGAAPAETTTTTAAAAVADAYASYQRRVLRSRSKPSIASLAATRRAARDRGASFASLLSEDLPPSSSDDGGAADDADDDDEGRWRRRPHSRAATVVLGEASSLIHPLAVWRDGLAEDDAASPFIRELCERAVSVLDDEAQGLASTVGEWFLEDRDVERWSAEAANAAANAAKATANASGKGGGSVDDGGGGASAKESESESESDLAELDATLDEMAFLCQVVSRYCSFSNFVSSSSSSSSGAHNDGKGGSGAGVSIGRLPSHLREQSLYYSTLETYLTSRNFTNALSLSSPVEIVAGKHVYVPSVVEDSYYISSRAIERASGTLCDAATGTVGGWVCDLWAVTTDRGGGGGGMGDRGGVCVALMEGRGCVPGPEAAGGGSAPPSSSSDGTTGGKSKGKKGGGMFASAFVDALDDEMGGTRRTKPPPSSSSSTKPTKIDRDEIRVRTQFCTLNGTRSASAACVSLSGLFDGLLEEEGGGNDDAARGRSTTTKPKEEEAPAAAAPRPSSSTSSSTSMVRLARDELLSHASSYDRLLVSEVRAVLAEWCGDVAVPSSSSPPPSSSSSDRRPCLESLRSFLDDENYEITTPTELNRAESDDRLESEFAGPLRHARTVRAVTEGRADPEVGLLIAREMSSMIAEIVLTSVLLSSERGSRKKKRFTDWGSLLLSKQVRLLQDLMCGLVLGLLDDDAGTKEGPTANTGSILAQFDAVNQGVTILQLEKPSDWSSFSYGEGGGRTTTTTATGGGGGGGGSATEEEGRTTAYAADDEIGPRRRRLTAEEIRDVMSLRVDFAEEAIAAACGIVVPSAGSEG